MANSWNGPQLGSPIRTDVPELQKKLIALLKQDPTSVANIPSGAKRLVNTSGTKWQVQQYNGSSWAAIGKLMHDVDKLDGYHAAITPAANTVAVRNADKKLEGDITGNAATASSATTLSETLPVNKGGTGAATSAAARTNLGVPPTSHASTNTTHGVGNATKYGHLKLSDATNNLSSVSGGVAATPAAVKAAKDAADAAQKDADDAMAKASETATASKAGIAYFPAPFTVGSDGEIGIRTATISQTGIVQLNNTVTSTSKTQAATANAVKTAYDKAEEAASKAGLPLGHIFVWPFPTPPDGSIDLNGSLYSRTLYADFFAYIKSKGQTKTETEWQRIAQANNGFCPWYSEGDGSTNFRTPKFAPYQKLSLVSADAGKYYKAGLPDASFYVPSTEIRHTVTGGSANIRTGWEKASQSLSKINSIYGNSTTVTPESHDWIVCAVAFGTATNVGSVDVANVMSAVEQVQANPNLQGTAHIVETWKSNNSDSWYRKWSDGFIEQGGTYDKGSVVGPYSVTITFPSPFTNRVLSLVAQTLRGNNNDLFTFPSIGVFTKTSFVCVINVVSSGGSRYLSWLATGY